MVAALGYDREAGMLEVDFVNGHSESYPCDPGQSVSYQVVDGNGAVSNAVTVEWPEMLRAEGNELYWHGYADNFVIEKTPGPIFYEVYNSHEFTPPESGTFRVRGKAYPNHWSN